MATYKGKFIPKIEKDKFKLGIYWDECIVAKPVDDSEDDGVADCPTEECQDCILSPTNIGIGLEYLIKEGIVTKEEALAFSLDKGGT